MSDCDLDCGDCSCDCDCGGDDCCSCDCFGDDCCECDCDCCAYCGFCQCDSCCESGAGHGDSQDAGVVHNHTNRTIFCWYCSDVCDDCCESSSRSRINQGPSHDTTVTGGQQIRLDQARQQNVENRKKQENGYNEMEEDRPPSYSEVVTSQPMAAGKEIGQGDTAITTQPGTDSPSVDLHDVDLT